MATKGRKVRCTKNRTGSQCHRKTVSDYQYCLYHRRLERERRAQWAKKAKKEDRCVDCSDKQNAWRKGMARCEGCQTRMIGNAKLRAE